MIMEILRLKIPILGPGKAKFIIITRIPTRPVIFWRQKPKRTGVLHIMNMRTYLRKLINVTTDFADYTDFFCFYLCHL
jgi:hypothetical protein